MKARSLFPAMRERGAEGGSTFPLHREIDRMFDDLTRGFGRLGQIRTSVQMPSVNVSETDGEVEFTAELPGMSEDEVDVTLTNDVLTISGEKKIEREEKDKNYWLVERSSGSFSRSFELPSGIDPSAVKAKMEKGVLTVTFPKPVHPESKKIEVQSAE